jgi:hypothetical protein
MTSRHRASLATGVALVAGFAAGCGNSSFSPTSPSAAGGSSAGATTGATISGRVIGAAAAPSSTTMATAAAAGGMTVKVSGTNIQSSVDAAGQFTLTGVPPGTVVIEFTGNGHNATITINGVNVGDRIEITVTVNGNHASTHSHHVKVEGPVSGLTGTCPALTFTVRGRQVTTDASTTFHDPCTSIQNNAIVEARGRAQADGSLLAVAVEVENEGDDDGRDDDGEDDDDFKVRGTISGLTGTCPALTFTVNGRTIMTTGSTRFDRGGCAAVQNGLRAEVEGTLQANGTVLATEIELD